MNALFSEGSREREAQRESLTERISSRTRACFMSSVGKNDCFYFSRFPTFVTFRLFARKMTGACLHMVTFQYVSPNDRRYRQSFAPFQAEVTQACRITPWPRTVSHEASHNMFNVCSRSIRNRPDGLVALDTYGSEDGNATDDDGEANFTPSQGIFDMQKKTSKKLTLQVQTMIRVTALAIKWRQEWHRATQEFAGRAGV